MSLTSRSKPRLHELADHRFAESFDVHRSAGSEVLDPPLHLRWALRINAAHRDLPLILYHRASALRALGWHVKFFLRTRAQVRAHAHDRRNNLAGFLDQDDVADPNVLPLDFLFVVQGGARDAAAANRHRLEGRDRSQNARATDLNQNVEQLRLDSLRFVLVGDRPARRLRGKAE